MHRLSPIPRADCKGGARPDALTLGAMLRRVAALPLLAVLALTATPPVAGAGVRTGIAAVDAPTAVTRGATLAVTARVRGALGGVRWAAVLKRRAVT